MRQEHDAFAGAGALVMVLPQKEASIRTYLDKHPTPFPILADPDRSRARDWGVYHPLGIDAFRTARPASFVIDGGGKVSFAHVASHQFGAPPVATVLEELRKTGGGGH